MSGPLKIDVEVDMFNRLTEETKKRMNEEADKQIMMRALSAPREELLGDNNKSPQQVIFHGGCHGCVQQSLHGGTKFCRGCQYYRADWSKPNLHSDNAKTLGTVDGRVLLLAGNEDADNLFIERMCVGQFIKEFRVHLRPYTNRIKVKRTKYFPDVKTVLMDTQLLSSDGDVIDSTSYTVDATKDDFPKILANDVVGHWVRRVPVEARSHNRSAEKTRVETAVSKEIVRLKKKSKFLIVQELGINRVMYDKVSDTVSVHTVLSSDVFGGSTAKHMTGIDKNDYELELAERVISYWEEWVFDKNVKLKHRSRRSAQIHDPLDITNAMHKMKHKERIERSCTRALEYAVSRSVLRRHYVKIDILSVEYSHEKGNVTMRTRDSRGLFNTQTHRVFTNAPGFEKKLARNTVSRWEYKFQLSDKNTEPRKAEMNTKQYISKVLSTLSEHLDRNNLRPLSIKGVHVRNGRIFATTFVRGRPEIEHTTHASMKHNRCVENLVRNVLKHWQHPRYNALLSSVRDEKKDNTIKIINPSKVVKATKVLRPKERVGRPKKTRINTGAETLAARKNKKVTFQPIQGKEYVVTGIDLAVDNKALNIVSERAGSNYYLNSTV